MLTPEEIANMIKNHNPMSERQVKIMAAKALVNNANNGGDVPKEAVFAAEQILEFELANDQMAGILATAKRILSKFDENADPDFNKNLEIMKALSVFVVMPMQDFGKRLKNIHETCAQHSEDMEAIRNKVADKLGIDPNDLKTEEEDG